MTDPVIKVENLSCLSGSRYLLNNINWSVERGEQWVVFGRNGCGKTTLLSIIAGYKTFTTGKLQVLGQTYTEENILALRKRIGWISSSFFDKYYHQERVKDIVLAGLTGTLGVQFEIADKDVVKAKELLTELGIGNKLDMPFDMLSKGERQHVLIARAFMTSPEIMILDEPGTGLDVLARERLLKMVQNLAQEQNTTLIYVTHYLEEILPSFDKCMLLRNGAVYQIGKTAEMITSANLSDFFNYPVKVDVHNGTFDFALASETEDNEIMQLTRKAGYHAE
jgi:iron complex transport system ATP-binding protein